MKFMAKRITKVTTNGDDGNWNGRCQKSNLVVKAIGELDELNSWVGLLCSLNIRIICKVYKTMEES